MNQHLFESRISVLSKSQQWEIREKAGIVTQNTQALELFILKKLTERVIVSFLDCIIMDQLLTQPLSGYDILNYVRKKYNYLLSPGTIYSTLYAMERKGLIKGTFEGKKRSYTLTKEGAYMTIYIKTSRKFREFLFKMLEPDDSPAALSNRFHENEKYPKDTLEEHNAVRKPKATLVYTKQR